MSSEDGIDSNDSLRWLHGRPAEWTRSSVNQFRVFLAYDPSELAEESRTLWEAVLPQLQNYASKFGLQVSFLDAFLNLPEELENNYSPQSTAGIPSTQQQQQEYPSTEGSVNGTGQLFVSPEDLRLLVRELEDCAQHAHKGYFFLLLSGSDWGPRVYPASISEDDWTRLKKVAQSINKDGLKHLEQMYQPSTERLKSYDLVPRCLDSKTSTLCNMYFAECARKKQCSFLAKSKNNEANSALFHLVKAALSCNPQGCLLVDMATSEEEDNHSGKRPCKKTKTSSLKDCLSPTVIKNQVSQFLADLIDKHPGSQSLIVGHKLSSTNNHGGHSVKQQSLLQQLIMWVTTCLTDSIRKSATLTRVEEITSHSVMSQVLHSQEILREQLAFPWEEVGRGEQEEGLRRHLLAGATSLHQPALIHGGQAHGKTRQMVRGLEIAWQLFSNEEVMSLVVFLRNSTHFLTFRDLVSYCTQCLLFFDGDDSSAMLTSKYTDTEKLEELLKELSSDTSRHYCLLLDDVDELYERASPEDRLLLLAFLSITLPPKTYIFATVTSPSSKTSGRLLIDTWKQQRSESLHGLLLPVLEIGTSTLCNLAVTAFEKHCSALSFVYKRLEFSAGSAEKMDISLRQLFQVFCSCHPSSIESINHENNSSGLRAVLQQLYAHFPANLVDSVLRYICSARKGLSQLELLELLSSDEQLMPAAPDYLTVYRFPLLVWLRLKQYLAPLLRWQLRHGRYLMYPASRPLTDAMRASLFTGSAQVRQVHHNLANLFLHLFSSSMELNSSVFGLKREKSALENEFSGSRDGDAVVNGDGITVQPMAAYCLGGQSLITSDASINPRRAEELWYHLMLSGDLAALKRYSFFNLGYLMAILRLWSPVYLLTCLDYALSRVLDSELQLLREGVILFSQLEDPDAKHLPGIVISRFRPVKDIFPALDQLVRQSMEWYDNQIEPVLVPLISWCEPPHQDKATVIIPTTGELRGPVLATIGGQHVVCLAGRGADMFHIASGTLVRRFAEAENKSMPNCMCFSNDCRRLFLGTDQGALLIFDVNSGNLLSCLDIHSKTVTCLRMCSSGDYLYSCSEDCLVQRICLIEESVVFSFKAHEASVTCLTLNTKETLLVTGSQDFKVKIWYTEDFSILIAFEDFTAPIVCLALSNENTFLLVVCADSSVSMKCPTTGNHIHNIEGHRGKISSLCVIPESPFVLLGGRDGLGYLHNLYTGQLMTVLAATLHGEPIISVNTLQENRYAVLLHSSSIRVVNLNLELKNLPVTFNGSAHLKPVRSVALSTSGKLGLSGCANGQVHVWSLDTIVLRATLDEVTTGPITCLDISPDGVWIVTAGESATCAVYDRMSLKQAGIFEGHTCSIMHVFFLADNQRVCSVDKSGIILVWSVVEDPMVTLMSLDKSGESYTISPDRENLVVSNTKTIELWNLDRMEHLRSHTTPEDVLTCIQFSPDGRMLLLGDAGRAVTVLESSVWSLSQILSDVHTTSLTCLTGDHSQDLVISGDTSGLIVVWRVDSGEDLLRLQAHAASVTAMQMTRDDLFLLSGSLDGYVKIWGLKTASCLSSFQVGGAIVSAVMDPDARRVLLHVKDLRRIAVLCLYNSPVSSVPSSPVVRFKRFKIRGGRDERRTTSVAIEKNTSNSGAASSGGGANTEPGANNELNAISLKYVKRPTLPGPVTESLQVTFERQDRLLMESINKTATEVTPMEQPILTDSNFRGCVSVSCSLL